MISKTDVSSAGGTVTLYIKQRDDVGVELTFAEAHELRDQLDRVLARDNQRTRLRAQRKR